MKHFTFPSLPDEIQEKLQLYADLLEKWQAKINLVSSQTLSDLWERHFKDSLQLVPYLPCYPSTLIDLGSGAGFPGLVVAMACQERINVTLVEANLKKCMFLENVSRETFSPVEILRSRIEEIGPLKKDIVVARGLTSLDQLCKYAFPFLKESSFCLFLKGKETDAEIRKAEKRWKFSLEIFPSLTDPTGRILKLSKLGKCFPDDKSDRHREPKGGGWENNDDA